LGVPGELDHPRVQNAVRLTIKACSRHGKIVAVGGAYQPDWLRLYAGMGVRMLLVGNDLSLLVGALRERASFAGRLDTDGKA
jgi:2-keto-3-deoxy-L-rhamnonate aldolase RhmA